VVTVKCKLPGSTRLIRPKPGGLIKLSGRWLTFQRVALAAGQSDLLHFSFAYLAAGRGQAFVACRVIQSSPDRTTKAARDVRTVNVVSETPARGRLEELW
jgi:hypothetical protein